MARSPQVPDEEYSRLVDFIGTLGYDTALIRKVPQNWEEGA
jgi:apolipoprotein D and lipocalin family protein